MPPKVIVDRVEHFSRHEDYFCSSQYNETELRREFLEPFFEALGWDVANNDQNAESYKDVTHEPTKETDEGIPDYCFRIGGTPKFYVEAKKPFVRLDKAPAPAQQVRLYAYSSKLPLSLLSNFKELAIYDTRIGPKAGDGPKVARVGYYTYDQYLTKWEEIEGRFSKKAVLQGSFDKFVVSAKAKKGTEEIDQRFLADMRAWRLSLAGNIALRNPELEQRELSFAVQRLLDRIVFLRICEDKGFEPYGQLRELAKTKNIYPQLTTLFLQADARYNSGLFHFKKEKDRQEAEDPGALKLTVDDSKLKPVLNELYYPERPYTFERMPLDILGKVYEQFIAQVVRVSPKRQVKIVDKPDLRRKEGVYYTPPFVVAYIVDQALKPLLENKSPKDVSQFRVLDPACGSGSFLIGAYQYLMKWYLDGYAKSSSPSDKKRLVRSPSGDLRLSLEDKKAILLRHIYGVDIDQAAVEVSKLSLFLALLEGESQLNLFHQKALPDLGSNLKCGNALIDGTFYDNEQMFFLTDEDKYRVNSFDWADQFPLEMKRKFDVVIGNPPYGYDIADPESAYYTSKYAHQDYQQDLYLLFLERYSHLLRPGGRLGIITSNTWLQSITLRNIRKHLATAYYWHKSLFLPEKVFDAVVDTNVMIMELKGDSKAFEAGHLSVDTRRAGKIERLHDLPWEALPSSGEPINVIHPLSHQALVSKIRDESVQLSRVMRCFNGIKPFEFGKGTPPQSQDVVKDKPYVHQGPNPGDGWSPLLRGSLIRRYQLLWNEDYWILYGPWLAAPRDPAIFNAENKVMVRQTGDSLIAAKIPAGYYARNNMHILIPRAPSVDTDYITALLNSKLMDFVYSCMNPEKGEALAEVKKQHVQDLPLPTIPDDNEAVINLGKKSRLISERLRKRSAASVGIERNLLTQEINALAKQIDDAVYSLYGLSDVEIELIERFASENPSSSAALGD